MPARDCLVRLARTSGRYLWGEILNLFFSVELFYGSLEIVFGNDASEACTRKRKIYISIDVDAGGELFILKFSSSPFGEKEKSWFEVDTHPATRWRLLWNSVVILRCRQAASRKQDTQPGGYKHGVAARAGRGGVVTDS